MEFGREDHLVKHYHHLQSAFKQYTKVFFFRKWGTCCCADDIMSASCRQGGVSDEVTLTAYITAAFLEMNISAQVSGLPEVQIIFFEV